MMLQVVTGSYHVWNARWLPSLLRWWTYVNLSQGEAIFFVPHWMSILYSSTTSWELDYCSDFLRLWHRVAPWWQSVSSPLVRAPDNVLFLHSRFLWRILQYLKSLPVICEIFVQAITRLWFLCILKCILTINQIVKWRTHLKFPEEARLTVEAKDFSSRLLCDVDHRLGTRGVAEIKVGCHLLDLLWLFLASRMVSRSLLVILLSWLLLSRCPEVDGFSLQ